MAKGRFQAPDTQGPERLRSPGVPSDTYAPPAKPEIDNNLTRLADALTAFGGNLAKYGTAANAAALKAEKEQMEQYAKGEIAGDTADNFMKRFYKGEIPLRQNPFAGAVIDKHAGHQAYEQLERQINTDIEGKTLDLAAPETDVDKLLTDRRNKMLDQLPPHARQNPVFLAGLDEKFIAGRQKYIEKQAKARDELRAAQLGNVAQTYFRDALDYNPDPVKAQAAIRNHYQALEQTIPREILEKNLLAVVKDRVQDQKTVEAALHALDAKRYDPMTNAEIPPLSHKPQYQNEIDDIRKSARTTLGKKLDTDVTANATAQVVKALEAKDGSVFSFIDQTYSNPYSDQQTKVLKADEIKKRAVTEFLTQSRQRAVDGKENEMTRFDREYEVLSKAAIPNPEWKQELEGAAIAFTNPAAIGDPDQRTKALAAAQKYLTLAERNRSYLAEHKLDQNTKDFYEVFDVVRKTGLAQNDDQALDMAARAIRTKDDKEDLGVRQARSQTIMQKVGALDVNGWWPGGKLVNGGAVQKQVSDVASVLVRAGLDPDAAVEAAVKTVKERTFFINGYAVPELGFISKEDKPLIQRALDMFVQKHGKFHNITDSKQLSVEPAGGGNLRIVDLSNGIPRMLHVAVPLTDQYGAPIRNPDGTPKETSVPATISMKNLNLLKKDQELTQQNERQVEQQQNLETTLRSEEDRLLRTADRFLSPAAKERKEEVKRQRAQEYIEKKTAPARAIKEVVTNAYDYFTTPRNRGGSPKKQPLPTQRQQINRTNKTDRVSD